MVDVRGDVLRPPHGITPAAVKSNRFHAAVTLALDSDVLHKHISCSVRVKDFYSSMNQNRNI